jgi:beta-mannosidase
MKLSYDKLLLMPRASLFLVLILGMSSSLSGKNDTLSLHGTWQLKAEGKRKTIPAPVPGTVHEALLAADAIPHPYLKKNERKVRWIEKKNWIYQRSFPWTEGDEKEVWLHLEGIDTYASIILNGDTVLQAGNMFRSWKVPIRKYLRNGNNEIQIAFTSPLNRHQDLSPLEQFYTGTAGNDAGNHKVSVLTRKAQYQFGWDWGPRLVGAGIWRPIYLVREIDSTIEDYHFRVRELSDSIAHVDLSIAIKLHTEKTHQFQLVDTSTGDTLVQQWIEPGQEKLQVSFSLKSPRRWWVPPLGQPHLYQLELTLSQDGIPCDQRTTKLGLRTIELVQSPDSIGTSYFFKLNGVPFFAKGANMIPVDALQPGGQEDKYRRLLEDAHAVGMNMIRVWGGGIYPPDRFYDLCDSLGILVWQDLMFACGMYPANESFLANVEAEVREQQKRLGNHPSLALWCGNNEVAVGWNNWGWQSSLGISANDSTRMIQGYQQLFDTLIPSVLEEDPSIPYVPTSPLSNWGTLENFNHSSMHYWGVWHGGDLLQDYEKYVGRFMSEYGFQSFPAPATVRAYAPKSRQQRLKSKVQKAHQKSYIGNEEILRQMSGYYDPPTDFFDFIYKSQLTQREGMRIAIQAQRGSKKHCMGSLYWQLNDCWPGPSWSSIDYFGRWKAFHYALYELYHPIMIIPETTEDTLRIQLVNDFPDTLRGTIRLEFFDLNGTLIRMSHHHGIQLPGNGHFDWEYPLQSLLPPSQKELPPPEQRCLRIYWNSTDGTKRTQTNYYWVRPNELDIPTPKIKLELDQENRSLRITGKSFIKDLFLEAGPNVHFQENFFDLLPGEIKEIYFLGPLSDVESIQVHTL